MFNKKFDKLVKEHPERFQYDFEVSDVKPDAGTLAALPEYLRKALAEMRPTKAAPGK